MTPRGALHYDTAHDQLSYWNGTSWVEVPASIAEIQRRAAASQRRADARRIAEVQRADQRPWLIGLALLAGLAITAFVLIALGLII